MRSSRLKQNCGGKPCKSPWIRIKCPVQSDLVQFFLNFINLWAKRFLPINQNSALICSLESGCLSMPQRREIINLIAPKNIVGSQITYLKSVTASQLAVKLSLHFYDAHFEITGDPCNLIGSQQCDLFTNRTGHLLRSQDQRQKVTLTCNCISIRKSLIVIGW